jgi:hypothetical protein
MLILLALAAGLRRLARHPRRPRPPARACRAATTTWSSSEGRRHGQRTSAVEATSGYYQAARACACSAGHRRARSACGRRWPCGPRCACSARRCRPSGCSGAAAGTATGRSTTGPSRTRPDALHAPAAPHGPVAAGARLGRRRLASCCRWRITLAAAWPAAGAARDAGARPQRGTRSNLPQFARAIEYAVGRLRSKATRSTLLAHSLGANAAAYAPAAAGDRQAGAAGAALLAARLHALLRAGVRPVRAHPRRHAGGIEAAKAR